VYKKILVPIDGSEISTRGLKEAIKFAKSQDSQIRLFHIANDRIVDSGDGDSSYGGQVIECARENGQKVLSGAVILARRHGLEVETVLVESIGGPAAAMIITEAREWPADLIVMGTHGRRGLRRLAMGSDAESVVRDTRVPVLLVHGPSKETMAEIDRRNPEDASKRYVYA
jgi:nucleotide-binding universal stress UspA family protein